MKKIYTTITLAAVCGLSSCQKKEEAVTATEESGATIEVLSHSQGKFTVTETISLDADQEGFAAGGKSFKLKARWDDAEEKKETNNTNPKESHAVELSWNVEGQDGSNWIFSLGSEHEAPLLKGTSVQALLLPPGARMAVPEEVKSSLLRGVQFEWKNKRYDITDPEVAVFAGWKVVGVRTFHHALLNEKGEVEESKDGGFSNRAVEVTIEADGGSTERHICFLDHPKLTAGIHPTLLPVTRLKGDMASLARLTVCETFQPPVEKSLLIVSPRLEGEGVNVWTWQKGEKSPSVSVVETYPKVLSLAGQDVEVKRHWANARRQIKWQQREGVSEEKKQPAILIETGGHFHAKQFVLIKGKVTPCRVMDDMIMLKYQ